MNETEYTQCQRSTTMEGEGRTVNHEDLRTSSWESGHAEEMDVVLRQRQHRLVACGVGTRRRSGRRVRREVGRLHVLPGDGSRGCSLEQGHVKRENVRPGEGVCSEN